MNKFKIFHILTECLLFIGLFLYCFNINNSLKKDNIILKKKNKKLLSKIANLEAIISNIIDPNYISKKDEDEDDDDIDELNEDEINKKKPETKTPVIMSDSEFLQQQMGSSK